MMRVFAAIIVLMDAGTVRAYDPNAFEGDGAIADLGFWSYRPRYRIELQPALSLTTPGRRQFRFKGVPTDPLSVFLIIQNDGDYQYERLRGLSTMVDLILEDESGRAVCRAVGVLSDWKLMWSGGGHGGAYWQRQCMDLRLGRREWYTLVVSVSNVDSVSPPLRVSPLLSGGGWDSP